MKTLSATLISFFALLLVWQLGAMLSELIPLPSSLLGLLILFFALVLLGRVPKALHHLSQFLLRHLSVFFIAPLLSAWLFAEQLAERLPLFIFCIVLSTFISFVISAWLTQALLGQDSGSADKPDHHE
jgi:holin-like protein